MNNTKLQVLGMGKFHKLEIFHEVKEKTIGLNDKIMAI